MKHLSSVFLFITLWTTAFSQESEFALSGNGLIYPDTTVKQLKYIVDSLNLKFRVCELNKVYLALPQSKAHYIALGTKEVQQAKTDMESNISFEDFIHKYGNSSVEKDLFVVRYKYKNNSGGYVVEFSSVESGNNYEKEISFDEPVHPFEKPLKGTWIYQYRSKNKYSDESISAFYFLEDLVQPALPERYARMMQYADCMVDTSASVMHKKESRNWEVYKEKEHPRLDAFENYVNEITGKPEWKKKNMKSYSQRYQLWDSLRFDKIDEIRRKDGAFDRLLQEAVAETMEQGGSDDEFEEYVGRYFSKKTTLELKRSRSVMGTCSMDDSPRVHALDIAKLSAETINWEIFLRAHLDIMNDRFERATDGSYAQAARKTYIRELEVLDINVLDLLLGISLRADNVSDNHYYGSINRLGRALSESNQSAEIETKMLQMIADDQLDDYNRVLMYYLFVNYNYHLENETKQAENKTKLKAAVNTLPEYLAAKMSKRK